MEFPTLGGTRVATVLMIKKSLLIAGTLSLLAPYAGATAAESYNPSWGDELASVNNSLYNAPTGSVAWLEDAYVPWWQNRVANPITDYNAALLPTGAARLDTALDVEYTVHRMLQSWTKVTSPSGINNVYSFAPGSKTQEDRTGRLGQNAFADLGLHPIETVSGDIGAEFVGNYDQRYWSPVNDEHRMFKDDRVAKVVRADLKYDDGSFLLRGFEGVAMPYWLNKNDLFELYPGQQDTEYPRREGAGGPIVPRGGQMRYKSDHLGTLEVIGGAETRWDYGSGVYAKYDAPQIGNLEQSLVYRNENITWNKFSIKDPDERRWALSYNSSYQHSERMNSHWGILYQPYRLGYTYADPDTILADGAYRRRSMRQIDAFGLTLRTEIKPTQAVDQVGLGYSYLGRAAGNKHQVDLDTRRTFLTNWTAAAAYIYRQPLSGPVPYRFEGTTANPGAILSTPRGPDDAFRIDWTNRKAHILNLTMIFDPTPGTWFFKNTPNILNDDNLNPTEDAEWSGAMQYTMTYYPTATDRQYYFDEDRNPIFDPIAHVGAQGTSSPFSSATGLLQWKKDLWHVVGDVSFGEALAGAGIAYSADTTYYKPSTVFVQTGMTVQWDFLKAFFRYGRNTWGPNDFEIQQGLIYKHVYQAGLSAQFLKQFETGFRYIGTRQDNQFLGADLGAFNEYRLYATWHFGLTHNFGRAFEQIGKPLPHGLPEASLTISEPDFTPDGSGPIRTVTLQPHATADAGLLNWRVLVRNGSGETVHTWDGQGTPDRPLTWDGFGTDGKPLPIGTYKAVLQATDVYGNDATSPPIGIELKGNTPVPAAPIEETLKAVPTSIGVKATSEGLRVTLNSLVLFDTGKSELKTSATAELDQVVKLLQAYPNNPLRISGHTDSVGKDAYNQKLSEDRAQSVSDYLETRGGISKARLRVVGWGKRRPVASNKAAEGRQQNRRVEIDILK
jgi:outer membrane protein OmpA-like peptidoglycan-associated protein